MKRFTAAGVALALILSAATAAAADDAIHMALANPARPAADRDTDSRRKPETVLGFFAIEPGMTVLDMYSGGGYYAEILAYTVGADGKVWAHNNQPYLNWLKDPIAARYADGRLDQVKRFTAENNELELPAATFDAVTMILCYHDIYHVDEKNGWTKIDGPALLGEIYQAMKPGAVLGVVDHAAAPGAPAESGETLHRIDPALAKKEIVAAGFVFEAQSNALRSSDDDASKSSFDESVRGKTDRFIYRFRKPE
jgi:predicted methyltransferase